MNQQEALWEEKWKFFIISCTARLVLCTLFFSQLNSLCVTKKMLFARNDLFKSARATRHERKELLKKCRFIKYSNWFQIFRKENHFIYLLSLKFTIINASVYESKPKHCLGEFIANLKHDNLIAKNVLNISNIYDIFLNFLREKCLSKDWLMVS